MKIVHIESGLGNQMLSYCEYLALKSLHPDEDIYIETIVFDIPEANEVIKQWNGYELERIFGIKAPNIKDYFTTEQWNKIMSEIRVSKWWDKNWNYPVYFTKAFQNAGLKNIINIRGNFESEDAEPNINMKIRHIPTFREKFLDTSLGSWLKRTIKWATRKSEIKKNNKQNLIFYRGDDGIFTGQWLALKFAGNGMERIEDEVRKVFQFPVFSDYNNIQMAQLLKEKESVFIHARRGDMLGCNGYCYKHGYFKRAIKYIRKHVNNPIFIFFCDPGSVEWCRNNEKIFGLNFEKDSVYFVDWNKGEESYRDMQLMACCKHAIITSSSFGWWGAFLIKNKEKITISPKEEATTNTSVHC